LLGFVDVVWTYFLEALRHQAGKVLWNMLDDNDRGKPIGKLRQHVAESFDAACGSTNQNDLPS
jgi:hypothetical protein